MLGQGSAWTKGGGGYNNNNLNNNNNINNNNNNNGGCDLFGLTVNVLAKLQHWNNCRATLKKRNRKRTPKKCVWKAVCHACVAEHHILLCETMPRCKTYNARIVNLGHHYSK